jgi:Na+-transporting NADH:ubiquinone oxidoreductase subunit C
MNKSSVGYILGFCLAICLVCSIVVSLSAVGLKDRQDLNKQLDRQKKVLVVSGLLGESASPTPDEIQSLFSKRIKAVVVDLKTGAVDSEATKNVANFDQQKAKKDPAQSSEIKKNLAGVPRVPNKGVLFLVSGVDMNEDGSGFVLDQYIFPIEGKGLWSTLYGYLSLAKDLNEIKGITFYAHGETPGLGGEIDNPGWKAKWPGRKVFGPDGKVKIKVKKGAAGGIAEDPYQVDGLSGATITSNGVSHLLAFWLGDNGFGPYIANLKTAGTQQAGVTR